MIGLCSLSNRSPTNVYWIIFVIFAKFKKNWLGLSSHWKGALDKESLQAFNFYFLYILYFVVGYFLNLIALTVQSD